MRCPECASPVADEDASFCGACGALLRSPGARAPAGLTPTRQDLPGDPPADERRELPADRAPRWLATAIALLLLAGVAVVAPRLTREPPPGVGGLDGERWRATLDTEPSFRFTNTDTGVGSPIDVEVASDGVYVTTGGNVAAYETAGGDRRWQRILPAPRAATVTGPVLAVATSGGIVALDRVTGEVRWREPTPGSAQVLVDGDAQIILSGGAGLEALDATDGRRRWSIPSPATGRWMDVVRSSGTRLFTLSTADGTVRGIDGDTGTIDWERTVPASRSMLPVVGDGNVYLETDRGEIVALDLLTGQDRWRVPSPPDRGTLTVARGVLVRWSRDGDLAAFAAEDGRPLWSRSDGVVVDPVASEDTVHLARRSPARILAVDARSGATRWERARTIAWPVAADAGGLYLAERDAIVLWDADDGTDRWRVSPAEPNQGPGYPTPVVAGERVFVTTIGGPLVALDRGSGDEVWRFDPAGFEDTLPTESPSGTTSVALPLGDRIVVASNRAVYTLAASSGEVQATFPTNVRPGAVPVLAGGHLVIDLGPSMVGLDPQTLRLRWQYTTPTQGARIGGHPVSAPTVHGEVILVGGGDGTLAGLDPATGMPVWDLDLGAAITSRPTVGDGIIVVRTETGDVRAFDADTGRARWREALSSTGPDDPAIAGGTVYATDGGELIALDLGSGMERWRTDLEGGDLSSPNAVGDVAYVGTAEGEIVAVSGLAGEVRWRFPAGAAVGAPPTVTDEELVAVTDDGSVISLH